MSTSAATVLYVLNKLRDAIRKGSRAIKEVRFDDQQVQSFEISKFELDIEKLDVALKFTPQGGARAEATALHYFRSSEPDIIKVNNDNVTEDNVDMDVDVHLLRADIEYRLDYVQSGRPHQIFMRASVDWF